MKPARAVRLVFLVESLRTGGTERHLAELLPRLQARGFRAEVWLRRTRGPFASLLDDAGVSIRRLSWLRLLALMLADRDAVIHSYLASDHFLDALLARVTAASYVMSTRNQGHWFTGSGRQRLILRLRGQLVRHHLVNSKAACDHLVNVEGVAPDRVAMIPNGLADRAQSSLHLVSKAAKSGFVLVVVSRLRPIKNVGFLIHAVARLRAAIPSLELVIVGDGPERAALHDLARQEGVAHLCKFVGEQSDPIAFLSRADLFVTASLAEGLSNALIEAAMVGLPALASSRGGNAEVLVDGVTGFLFDPDVPEQFDDAVRRLAADRSAVRKLGTAARLRFEQCYQLERQVDAFCRYYEALCGLDGPSAGSRGA